MADTKISALSAGTALAGTEEIPGVQSAATVKFTPAQIKTYVLAVPVSVTGGTITSDANALSITQTWNAGGVTFTGALKVNVTNTASASGSRLAAFQIGGSDFVSIRNVSSAPQIVGDGSNPTLELSQSNGTSLAYSTTVVYVGSGVIRMRPSGNNAFAFHSGGGAVTTGSQLYFSSSSLPSSSSDSDVGLTRAAAGVLKVTNASSGSGALLLAPVAVASLPSASTAGAGARHTVNDSSVTTFGSTVSGGGSTVVPVYSDGTNWKVG